MRTGVTITATDTAAAAAGCSDNALGPPGVRKCAGGLASLDTLERVYFCNNGLSAEAGTVRPQRCHSLNAPANPYITAEV